MKTYVYAIDYIMINTLTMIINSIYLVAKLRIKIIYNINISESTSKNEKFTL